MALAGALFPPFVALMAWPAARPAPVPKPSGLVFVVGGVGGVDMVGPSVRKALPKYGLRHEVRVFVWTHGTGKILRDLQDTPHLLQKADELASEILRAREEQPDRPIFVVAKSGGAGLSLLAAERLPPCTLERIILLSAAVTPTYDLRPALRATRGEIVSFYSSNDWLVLG